VGAGCRWLVSRPPIEPILPVRLKSESDPNSPNPSSIGAVAGSPPPPRLVLGSDLPSPSHRERRLGSRPRRPPRRRRCPPTPKSPDRLAPRLPRYPPPPPPLPTFVLASRKHWNSGTRNNQKPLTILPADRVTCNNKINLLILRIESVCLISSYRC
jgi:hypothetical protein